MKKLWDIIAKGRVTDPYILGFFEDYLEGDREDDALYCEHCNNTMAFEDKGDYFDLYCVNRKCPRKNVKQRVYKEDLE